MIDICLCVWEVAGNIAQCYGERLNVSVLPGKAGTFCDVESSFQYQCL